MKALVRESKSKLRFKRTFWNNFVETCNSCIKITSAGENGPENRKSPCQRDSFVCTRWHSSKLWRPEQERYNISLGEQLLFNFLPPLFRQKAIPRSVVVWHMVFSQRFFISATSAAAPNLVFSSQRGTRPSTHQRCAPQTARAEAAKISAWMKNGLCGQRAERAVHPAGTKKNWRSKFVSLRLGTLTGSQHCLNE